ncbi:MAG: YrdB family protein [Dehalococcoidia bacterium]
MNPVRAGNLGLRFALELSAMAALAYGGYQAGSATWQRWLLAIALPAAAATLWGLFVSPKAKVPAHWVVQLAVEAAVFGAAFGLLFASRRHGLAVGFGVVAVVSRAVKGWFDVREGEGV